MFTMTKQAAKVAAFNPRAEKHGEENVPAGDIKFQVAAHSTVLDHFHPGLRKLLYRKPGPGEQDELPLGDGDGRVALAVPRLKGLSWDEDFPGYSLTIHNDFIDSLVLTVELCKFRFDAIEGGSVQLTFSARCEPDAAEAGALCQLIQEEVEITLAPPTTAANEQREAA